MYEQNLLRFDYKKFNKLLKLTDKETSNQIKKELMGNPKLQAMVAKLELSMDIRNVYTTALVEYKLWLKSICIF